MIRSDAALKASGAALFGVDLELPGMLWGALVPAPVAHGRLRSIDLGAARRAPGVVAAIGPEEVRALLPSRPGEPPRTLFPTEEILYRHQPVAAVAARTLAEARAAAARVTVDVEPLPIRADLDSVLPEWPEPGTVPESALSAHVHARWGDVEGEFERADRVRREQFRTSGVLQVPLEPHACLAERRGATWHVATSTQTPFGVREDLVDILGVPAESIEVEGSWVGGGFGAKGAALLEPYALVLSAAAGAPVRLALSYREEFQLTRSTLPARFWMASAVRDGRLVARTVRVLLDTGASLPGRDFATGYSTGFLLGPYSLRAFEVEGYGVRTHKPPFGPHRAPFVPQCVFVTDGHTDALARELGADPIEFRERQAWRAGDSTPFGQTVGPFGGPELLAQARTRAEQWRRELPAGTGIGVGFGYWSTNTGAGGEATVRLGPTELTILEGEREIGSGSVVRGLAAVAERSLGVPAAAVRVEYGDTGHAPYDSGVFGSRTLGALGGAVAVACGKIAAELGRRLGSEGPVRLTRRGDALLAEAGERSASVEELLTPEERRGAGLVASGRHYGRGGPIDEGRVLAGEFYPYTDFTAAVHLAAVTVDRATGQVRVLRLCAWHDAGTVVDLPTYSAQVEGGVVMGLGTALTEESMWGADGRLENATLLDYRVPTIVDVPPIEVVAVEGFPGAGPFGAKGIGEPPIVPVAAAVANAVADATGVRLHELPLTPERVARALMVS